MLDFVHGMVFNAFPLIGFVMIVLGFIYGVVAFFFADKFKAITLGISYVIFGYWLKHIHYFKIQHATHGFLSSVTQSFLVTLITKPQNHWILLGIIPAIAMIAFAAFSIKEKEADVYVLAVAAFVSVVCLAIGLSWIFIYYSQYPSFLSANALSYP